MPVEEIDANRSSNTGVLSDDVTIVLWVNLGMQKIVGEVTLPAAITADNRSKGKIMDLVRSPDSSKQCSVCQSGW